MFKTQHYNHEFYNVIKTIKKTRKTNLTMNLTLFQQCIMEVTSQTRSYAHHCCSWQKYARGDRALLY